MGICTIIILYIMPLIKYVKQCRMVYSGFRLLNYYFQVHKTMILLGHTGWHNDILLLSWTICKTWPDS